MLSMRAMRTRVVVWLVKGTPSLLAAWEDCRGYLQDRDRVKALGFMLNLGCLSASQHLWRPKGRLNSGRCLSWPAGPEALAGAHLVSQPAIMAREPGNDASCCCRCCQRVLVAAVAANARAQAGGSSVAGLSAMAHAMRPPARIGVLADAHTSLCEPSIQGWREHLLAAIITEARG